MKYIFWDFNGTVLDDAYLCFEILNEMLIEEDRPIVSFEEYLMIFDFPVEAYYAKVYDLEKTSFEILAHRFIERYQPRSLKLQLHHGVIDAIKHFEKKGFINIMLSASEINNLHRQLEHFKIKNLFKHILGTSDVYAKSKVDVAKRFIEENKIDPKDIMMVGDTLHDVEVAEELGCEIILFTKGHQHKDRLNKYKSIDEIKELYQIL
ncbi:MAG: HAD family hydrolase [Acholeplasmataceae bacterium]|nr:HAD family hydrolase [Acholeplasmataceae bacterium]